MLAFFSVCNKGEGPLYFASTLNLSWFIALLFFVIGITCAFSLLALPFSSFIPCNYIILLFF